VTSPPRHGPGGLILASKRGERVRPHLA
jgi:hypothetical protein